MNKKFLITGGFLVAICLMAVLFFMKNNETKKENVPMPDKPLIKIMPPIKMPQKMLMPGKILPPPTPEAVSLFEAIKTKNNALAKELIGKGVDINSAEKDTHYTPFVIASKSCNVEMLKIIGEKNPDMTIETASGSKVDKSALMNAGETGCVDAVKYLVETKKMDINTRHDVWGETLLYKAADKNNIEMAKFVIEKGIDPTLISVNKLSALDVAKKKNNKEIVLLIEDYLKKFKK